MGRGGKEKCRWDAFSLDKEIAYTYNRKIVEIRSLMWLSFGSLRTE
jgi:hypothetical protein